MFFQLLAFLFLIIFEILTITVVNALIPCNYVQCQPCLKRMSVVETSIRALWLRGVESSVRIKNIMGHISIADRRTIAGSQTIADDRLRSQDRRRSQKCVSI